MGLCHNTYVHPGTVPISWGRHQRQTQKISNQKGQRIQYYKIILSQLPFGSLVYLHYDLVYIHYELDL